MSGINSPDNPREENMASLTEQNGLNNVERVVEGNIEENLINV